MTFTMFVGWALAGLLAGVLAGLIATRGGYGLKGDIYLGLAGAIGGSWALRAVGLAPGSNVVVGAIVAFVFAGAVIAAQRMFRSVEPAREEHVMVWRWALGAVVVAIIGWMMFGPAQQPAATAAAIQDKTYTVTPATTKLKAGIVTAELMDLKVTERVEDGSGRIVSPAKLTGRVTLKNTSRDQTVRLLGGKLRYVDGAGQPVKLEDMRTEPTIKFSSSASDRLDPGQESSESLDVDFPTAALTEATLKTIYLDIAYIPSPYREETARFGVAISGGK
jgi:uncharacterized membrane protein YeaQ/YmgE (transglycosylase-associated protein family)